MDIETLRDEEDEFKMLREQNKSTYAHHVIQARITHKGIRRKVL